MWLLQVKKKHVRWIQCEFHTIPETNSSPLKIGNPKRKRESIPTIHFQVLWLSVSGRVFFDPKNICQRWLLWRIPTHLKDKHDTSKFELRIFPKNSGNSDIQRAGPRRASDMRAIQRGGFTTLSSLWFQPYWTILAFSQIGSFHRGSGWILKIFGTTT